MVGASRFGYSLNDAETGGGSLDAMALDTLALLEARWHEVVTALDRRFPDSELSSIAPEELSALPGIQEVLGLHAVGELAASGRWDRVVVDCASTADALRMLTLPATFGLYVERAWPRHRRLSITADDPRSAAVVELIERISVSVEALSALLTDGELVSAHLVLTPERVVAAEAVRTLGSLALMGVRVEELIVNQVLVRRRVLRVPQPARAPGVLLVRRAHLGAACGARRARRHHRRRGAGDDPALGRRADRPQSAGRIARQRPSSAWNGTTRSVASYCGPRIRDRGLGRYTVCG